MRTNGLPPPTQDECSDLYKAHVYQGHREKPHQVQAGIFMHERPISLQLTHTVAF